MVKFLPGLVAPGSFRFLLSLLVVIHHSTRFNVGVAAVYIFFVLSGYWITKMWLGRYTKTKSPYTVYIISRVWRILPVFVLCSAVSWVFLYCQGTVPDLAGGWAPEIFSNLFALGYANLAFAANPPSWTLDIELQFYIIAPALVMAMATRNLAVLIGVAALAGIGGYLNVTATIVPYLVFFAIGVASAQSGWRPARSMAVVSLVGSAALILACVLSPYKEIILGGTYPGPWHTWNPIACITLGFTMAPCALYTTGRPRPASDVMYGDLSYIVYLIHWPIMSVFNTASGTSLRHLVQIATGTVFVMIASVLIWRFYDSPINRLRANWVAGKFGSGQPRQSTVPA